MKIPIRYLPASLTKKDKKKQIKMLMKSKKLYRTKKQYYTRKPLASYKNKTSKHILKARKIYNIKNLTPSKELARKTGCSLSALKQIVKMPRGLFFIGFKTKPDVSIVGNCAVSQFHYCWKGGCGGL